MCGMSFPSGLDRACCAEARWGLDADLGRAHAFEILLGRCVACGKRWAHVWSEFVPGGSFVALESAAADALLELAEGKERTLAALALLDL